ncbi:hypothetical protein [Erwinia phage FBB1]|nr:hypothetical protein [Erwinia phage FBB1]
MRNYKNYSVAHYEAAKKFISPGLCECMDTALAMTQSTLPGERRIKDPVETLYIHPIDWNKND